MNNVSLSGGTTVFLSINLLKDILDCFLVLAVVKEIDISILCAGFCVDISFQLIWINTKRHNCCIIW